MYYKFNFPVTIRNWAKRHSAKNTEFTGTLAFITSSGGGILPPSAILQIKTEEKGELIVHLAVEDLQELASRFAKASESLK